MQITNAFGMQMFWQCITLAGNFEHCKKKGDQQSHERGPVSV